MLKTDLIDARVYKYLRYKLQNRAFNRRPLKISYTIIKKAVNRNVKECELLSYKQIRGSIDRLVKNKIVEKYLAWDEQNKRVLFLRLYKPIL